MAAANTDKFRKKKNLFSTTLSGSITDSDTSLSCASLSGVPTDTAVTITIDRVDANGISTPSLREDITGVVSGNNLTNLVRGEGATTAQAHANNAAVELAWETETWNDAVDAILVAHNQDGTHKSGSVLTLPQINDTSSDHQYVFAVNELAADRTVTLPLLTGADEFVFKDHAVAMANKTFTSPVFNTAVSGTAVLDEDTMSSDSATKLATQQSIKAYVDGKTGDWTLSADTWTYASASTFTIAGVDRTTTYRKGTRLKFSQTSEKYAVVVGSSFSTNTTVTIAVNSDYVIENAAITSPYYSYTLTPAGYPAYFSITPSTSNITGFSAIDGYVYRYSMVGAAIHVFFQIGGTSNSASFTITLPAAVAAAGGLVNVPIAVKDNGTWQSAAGIAAANPSSSSLLIGKTIPSLSGGTYAGFTTSGSKYADGSLIYYV